MVSFRIEHGITRLLFGRLAGRSELVKRAYGGGKPGLNLDNIRSLPIPLAPLAEQQRIIAKVDELMALCDRLEAQLATTQSETSLLLEAVLHQALKTRNVTRRLDTQAHQDVDVIGEPSFS